MAQNRNQVDLGGFATGTLASSVFGPEPVLVLVLEPVLEPARDGPAPALELGLGPELGPEPELRESKTLAASVGQSFGAVAALVQGMGSYTLEGPWCRELRYRQTLAKRLHL